MRLLGRLSTKVDTRITAMHATFYLVYPSVYHRALIHYFTTYLCILGLIFAQLLMFISTVFHHSGQEPPCHYRHVLRAEKRLPSSPSGRLRLPCWYIANSLTHLTCILPAACLQLACIGDEDPLVSTTTNGRSHICNIPHLKIY